MGTGGLDNVLELDLWIDINLFFKKIVHSASSLSAPDRIHMLWISGIYCTGAV